ncbi:COP9 signalosome complex subunit 8 isoform X1 [Antechinus flavipes]|uniref:COP9 signalosome complex subunit 8 isoform X1 n=1 Tax=Antechinus flavipes TaxID=38775 RepID=UPI002236B08C|nr:COP9 signalosome complex subunit 8 isoform X1 [Antechinus flavipes]
MGKSRLWEGKTKARPLPLSSHLPPPPSPVPHTSLGQISLVKEHLFFSHRMRGPEDVETEAPGGIATPPVYGQLLALYLLHNDMNNARYLWKRIPPAIKSANSELGGIWSVGQRIWQRDFPGIYTTISSHQWSETIQPIMEALRDATRRRAFALVSQAYTSIIADDFAAFVGLPVEEAVKGVLEQGWQADSTTRMVMPKKPGSLDVSFNRFIPLSEPAPVPPIPNEQQLARLTDYVAFLEN